jgi:hypothetical protein
LSLSFSVIFTETRDGEKYQEYAKLRNQVKNSVKKAKMSMERDIARDVKKNPKKFWKYANSKRKTIIMFFCLADFLVVNFGNTLLLC